ncbi:MAG TPA: hypothetical protein VHA78_02850 [Candidatus Peribacteraceae bacterium]|nr:hypothetical protein [Candidatus Peribacteraceae bacterium]
MDLSVGAPGKTLGTKFFLLCWIANLVIYLAFFPLVVCHALCWLYQLIAFSIYDIPKIRLHDYLSVDRGKLKKLNGVQRLNCVYCGYANGVLAWMTATAHQTEAYACGIKHNVMKVGQEYQKDFHEYKKFL